MASAAVSAVRRSPQLGRRMTLDPESRGWTVLAAGACLLPLLLQLPGGLAALIAVVGLAATGLSWRRPVPAWARWLLALVLAIAVLATMRMAIGRDTGCAMLAAMLAIKPTETFHLRDARSLVGFALFAPFATFLLDQGPVSMALALIAVTLALAALQKLAELESQDSQTPPAWQRFGRVWRMVAFGLPLALAFFWLFPRLATPLWGVPDRALARTGLSGEMSPGEWADLLVDDSPALRARFFGPTPQPTQLYWRGPVLWDFDGRTWRQPEWLSALPPEPVQRGPVAWDYEIALEPTDRHQLIALDLPLAAPEGAQLSLGHGLHVAKPLAVLTRWRLRSAPPRSFATDLSGSARRHALSLPQGLNPRTVALGRQWRAEAGADDAAIVQRALEWVQRDFAYTLATLPSGRHGVDEFLFDTREGFCQHFSSSFAVLMRAAGIPARVVTGYAGGYRNPIGDYWLVRRSDAHAWNEVWLPAHGWVRVDPTAAVAPERIYDTIADRRPGAGGLLGGIGGLTPVWDVGDWMRRGWNDFVLGFDAARQRRLLAPLGLEATASRLILVLGAMAALAMLVMLWLVARGEREHDPVLRAWHQLGRRHARYGLQPFPHEPAQAWAARVAEAGLDSASNLNALSHRFADWRYAAGNGDARVARELARDLRAHRP